MILLPQVNATIKTAAYRRFSSRRCNRAFTLVELLVVISIIAVLAAILLSVIQKSRETANSVKCMAKLRAIGNAVSLYRVDKGAYPKMGQSNGSQFTGGSWWFSDVMPYLSGTLDSADLKNDVKDTPLRCPAVKIRSWPFIDYGINGYILPHGPNDIPVMKVEGPSTTFLAADSDVWSIASWTGDTLDKEFRFRHGNTANMVMFDGHVEKVTKQQLADRKFEKRVKGLPE